MSAAASQARVWVDADPYGKRVFGSPEAIFRLSARQGHSATAVPLSEHEDALQAVSASFRRKVQGARSGQADWVHALGRVAGTDRFTHQLVVFDGNGAVAMKVDHTEKEAVR